jgi:hypothetical protein
MWNLSVKVWANTPDNNKLRASGMQRKCGRERGRERKRERERERESVCVCV